MSGEMRSTHTELKQNVAALDYNANRALSGVKSAHTAYRSQLQDIKRLCDKLRKATLEHQRSLPTKKRVVQSEIASQRDLKGEPSDEDVEEEKKPEAPETPPPSDDDETEEGYVTPVAPAKKKRGRGRPKKVAN